MYNVKILMVVLFFGLAGLSSCKKDEVKKEDLIRKDLWSNGGEWKLTKLVERGMNGDDLFEKISYDEGTFSFEENGKGVFIPTIIGYDILYFKYENTEFKLTLNYYDEDGDYGQQIWALEWEEKRIELFLLYESDENGYTEVFATLEKE